jgi:hypothetical protein
VSREDSDGASKRGPRRSPNSTLDALGQSRELTPGVLLIYSRALPDTDDDGVADMIDQHAPMYKRAMIYYSGRSFTEMRCRRVCINLGCSHKATASTPIRVVIISLNSETHPRDTFTVNNSPTNGGSSWKGLTRIASVAGTGMKEVVARHSALRVKLRLSLGRRRVSDRGKRGGKQVTDAREVRADRAELDVPRVQHVNNEVAVRELPQWGRRRTMEVTEGKV